MCKKSKFPLVFNIFLAFFITLVPAIFVVAYITAAIVFIPSMKATAVICSRED